MSALTGKKPFHKHSIFLGAVGFTAAAIVYFLVPGDRYPNAPWMAALITLMALWWILEVAPVPVTSLFPLIALPAIGINTVKGTALHYGEDIIFLFLGGFILALALQNSGLHKRISLHIVRLIGTRPSRLVLGFMLATGFLSMWISNTATVMVMLPIALSVVKESEGIMSEKDIKRFALCLMLGIGHSADIGGLATYVGTPPNLAFQGLFQKSFPGGAAPSFAEFAAVGTPLSIIFLLVGWVLLTQVFFRFRTGRSADNRHVVRDAIRTLGPIRQDELVTGIIFAITALCWITGSDISFGERVFHGWRSRFGLEALTDPAVAIIGAVILFLLPSGDRKGKRLMEWQHTRELPWGILLLFGGGFAIAGGFEKSGLSCMVGDLFEGIHISSPILMVLVVCIAVALITEVMSNTACVTLVIPILAQAAPAMHVHPLLLLLPATFAATCGFMMPVASPTQAIIFSTGYIPVRKMIWTGLWFDIVAVLLITLITFTLGEAVLHLGGTLPDWAANPVLPEGAPGCN